MARDRAPVTEVADGVHRLATHHVSCYLVVDGDEVTLVDAGLPATWKALPAALASLGRRFQDLRAVVLTHAHFDHIGIAERLRREKGVVVHLHPEDAWLAAHPYRYRHERARPPYLVQHPRALPGLTSMVAGGALRVPPLHHTRPIADREVLEVPGRPVVHHTPGHTDGHCVLHLPERSVLLTGDALVTTDPYTARRGPQLVARAATASVSTARESLGRIRALEADVLLPGHGDPFTGGTARAVDEALAQPVQ
ncbi:MBL fold metallo-hydrolase [Auraticoccus monumenti]|uniref:Glyoxylase, beta-lactamase superfamily II n=1 Tax=Auraticoccus monumenti TaxID=675864 RepID=A0A1G6WXR5_9ACTN|nr:MBL fold metallo-hydrolase [Auraticoccus monumenti]SDD70702.1 Glyoxylase, beta-lactamase superfamily II [Auraticoccus monumenti]